MNRIGFWRRVGAFLIDYVLIYILANASLFFYIVINAERFQSESALADAAETFGYIWWMLGWPYFALLEGLPWGATPGKYLFGIKVVSSIDTPFNFLRSIQRSFSKIFISQLFLGLGYIMVAFRPDKLAMHDLFTKTMVVWRKPELRGSDINCDTVVSP